MKNRNLPQYSSLISGSQVLPKEATGEWLVKSPARADHPFARCVYSYAQIDQAIDSSIQGIQSWKALTRDQKMIEIKKGFEQVWNAKEHIVATLQAELGRTDADVELEFKQIQKWWSGFQEFQGTEMDPRGTTALIGSYVWPIFYTLQFTLLNLLAGNSVIIKPSERATLSVLKMVETLIAERRLFSHGISVLIGEKEVGRRVACHEAVNTVIFVGSFENGIRVKQNTLSQPSKRILLYLGAKNPVIVCEDFLVESSAGQEGMEKIIQDSFLSTGQHCRSGSLIFVHDAQYQAFLKHFHDRAKGIKIGGPAENGYMGPVIDDAMADRYLKFVGISEREGAEIQMRGKSLSLSEKGFFVTPTLLTFESLTPTQMKKSVSLQTEILSPHISIVRYSNYDELLSITAEMQNGLCASIWGENSERNLKIANDLNFGQVSINQSLLEWDPTAGFQARKKSGNHAYHGPELFRQVTTLKSILNK